MCPNFPTNRVGLLNYTKSHISTNLLSFLKLGNSRLSELILGTPPIEILNNNNMNVIKHFLKIIMVAKQHPEDNSNDAH